MKFRPRAFQHRVLDVVIEPRLDDQRARRHQKAVARAVGLLECFERGLRFDKGHDERSIGAFVAQMHARDDADARRRHVLREHFIARGDGEIDQRRRAALVRHMHRIDVGHGDQQFKRQMRAAARAGG